MKRHPFGAAAGDLSDPEYKALRADLNANGQLDDITIHDNMILDGWHRYELLEDLGIAPRLTVFKGSAADAAKLVISRLKGRRESVTVAMAAMIAENLRRQLDDYVDSRKCKTSPAGEVGYLEKKTIREVAEEAGVSGRSLSRAKKIADKAAPALVDAVATGKVDLGEAERVLDQPHEVQVQCVEAKLNGHVKRLEHAVPEKGDDLPEEILDKNFVTVPIIAHQAFLDVELFDEALSYIDKAAKVVAKLAETPSGKHLHPASIQQSLDNVRTSIRNAVPMYVCPYCQGAGCQPDKEGRDGPCREQGWVSASVYKAAPPEKKKAMEKEGKKNVPS